MEEQARLSATDLLQLATTVSAIAIALATFALDEGPTIGDVHLIPLSLLLAGLLALFGSLYAMAEIWREAGMSLIGLLGDLPRSIDRPDPYRYTALVVTTWDLVALNASYVFLLVATAPS